MQTKNRSLLFNSVWRLAQVMGGGGFAAVHLLIYTAALPKAQYGIYGVAISVAYLFQLLGIFGLRQAASRFVARARGAGELGQVRGYVLSAVRMSAGLSLAAVVVFAILASLLSSYFAEWPRALVPLLAAYIGAKALSFVLQGTMEGSGLFKEVSITSLGLNLVQLAVLSMVWLGGLDIVKVLAIEGAVAWLSVAVFGYEAKRWVLARLPRDQAAKPVTRELFWFGLPLLVNALGGFLYGRVDILFIHAYLRPEDSADYYLMFRLLEFPLLALGAYVFVLNTDVAHALGGGNKPRIVHLFWRSEAVGAGLGVVLAAAFFGASYLVPFVLPEYDGAMVLMRLAAPILVVKCVAQIASGAFMVSLGRPTAMAVFTVTGGILNVALNFLLIPQYGTPGAVYSTLIGHTLMGVITFVYAMRGVLRLRGAALPTGAA